MQAWAVPAQGLNATGVTGVTGSLSGAATTLDLTNTTSFGGGSVRFGSSSSLIYDAANSIGLRNGTNAQTFSVYNTFTAGTPDYERLEMFWTSNVSVIRNAQNGTGSGRNLEIRLANTTTAMIRIATTVGAGVQIAPSGNTSVTTATYLGIGVGGGQTSLSGTTSGVILGYSLSDGGTTSTTVHNALSLTPTINYTAASKTGKVVLALFSPTNTSLPTGQNAGISFGSTHNVAGFPAVEWNNQTDADTNYEKVTASFVSNVFTVSSISGGSGTTRNITFSVGNPAGSAVVANTGTSTITGGVTDGFTGSQRLTPIYNAGSALTVTRHNYIDLNTPTLGGAGPAAVTDAAVFRFDAAPGTHKALAADAAVAVTFTALGPTGAQTTIQGWMKINVNGTLRYIPFW